MKKCVNCQRKFDDTVAVCPHCGIWLIADTVSDLKSDHAESIQRELNPAQSELPRRRVNPVQPDFTSNRVNPVQPDFSQFNTNSIQPGALQRGYPPVHDTSTQPAAFGGFQPGNAGLSSTAPELQPHRSRGRHRHGSRRALQIFLQILRYAIPIALIGAAIFFIVRNWEKISEVIGICLVGGIIGGAFFTWLSARGRHYSVNVTLAGVVIGMIISCILTYNLFGVKNGLSDAAVGIEGGVVQLLSGIVPILIVYIALSSMARGFRRRR